MQSSLGSASGFGLVTGQSRSLARSCSPGSVSASRAKLPNLHLWLGPSGTEALAWELFPGRGEQGAGVDEARGGGRG